MQAPNHNSPSGICVLLFFVGFPRVGRDDRELKDEKVEDQKPIQPESVIYMREAVN